MQEQLLEKCVHEYHVPDPNPSPHHYFQYCKQQTGCFSVHLLLFSPLILLTHCISVVVPQIFPVVPQQLCSPPSDVLLIHINTLPLDPFWLLFLFLHCHVSFLLFDSPPARSSSTLHPHIQNLASWEKWSFQEKLMVCPWSWEQPQAAVKSTSQVGGGEFLLMRMRGTRITWGGGKKNHQILLLSVVPLLSRRGGFQEVSPM